MIIKKSNTYKFGDNPISYSLIDNIEKIEVGCDKNHGQPRNYINMFLKGRKDSKEFEKLWVDDITVYVCNDSGKTIQVIKPYIEDDRLN